MSVQNVQTIIYNALRTLLEVEGSYFAEKVLPGNRIWMMGDKIDPEKQNKTTADYPESMLDYADFTYSSGEGRYGQGIVTPTGRTKTLIQTFQLTLTHRDMRAKINDPLNMAIVDLIEAGGPTLGIAKQIIPHVERGDIRCSGATYGVDNNLTRARFVFTFPVTARWKGEPSPTRNA